MNTDDKKTNSPENDGISELLDAFGKYDEQEKGENEIVNEGENISAEVTGEFSGEEISIVLHEVSFEDEKTDNEEDVAIKEVASQINNVKKKNKKNKKNKKTAVNTVTSDEEKPTENVNDSVSDAEDIILDVSVENDGNDGNEENKENKDIFEDASNEDKEDKTEDADEDTVSPDDGEAKPSSPAKLVIVLTAICAAVALLLATVNHFTETKITENTEKAMLSSIQGIFDENIRAEAVSLPEDSQLDSAYLVMKNDGVCGYAASVSPTGFGGPVSLMVGVDSEGTVVGVKIISMSETPGLGSRVGGAGFLEQFSGKSGSVAVDAISGATISSKAVASGVNSVTEKLLDLSALAADKGMSLIPYIRETATETVTIADTAETDKGEPETVPAVTEEPPVIPLVTKADAPPEIIVANPNNEAPGIYAEHEEGTIEYETLTTEPESSELDETSVSE